MASRHIPPEVFALIARTLSPKNAARLAMASRAARSGTKQRRRFLFETRRKHARAPELRPAGERRAKRIKR